MAKKSIPKLCRHPRGRGYVTDPFTRKEVYLGRYGTPECTAAYEAWVSQLLARRVEVASGAPAGGKAIIADLVADFMAHAKVYYRKHGQPTSQVKGFATVADMLVEAYGTMPAGSFGPAHLKQIRQAMIGKGWALGHINAMVSKIRKVFRWGVEMDLVRVEVLTSLEAVAGLPTGRTGIREEQPVPPVPLDLLWTTVFLADARLGRLIRLQLYGSMRVEEVVALRGRDIDREQWLFQPWSWKTEHHVTRPRRRIWLGPRAREILGPMLARVGDDAWLFPARTRHGFVNPDVYGHQLKTCCERHGLPHWFPSQIRHSALSLVRKHFGLEAAQSVGDHADANTTEIYAERNEELARKAAEELG